MTDTQTGSYTLYIKCRSKVEEVEEITTLDHISKLSADEVKQVTAALALDLHDQGYYIAWHYGSMMSAFDAWNCTHTLTFTTIHYSY